MNDDRFDNTQAIKNLNELLANVQNIAYRFYGSWQSEKSKNQELIRDINEKQALIDSLQEDVNNFNQKLSEQTDKYSSNLQRIYQGAVEKISSLHDHFQSELEQNRSYNENLTRVLEPILKQAQSKQIELDDRENELKAREEQLRIDLEEFAQERENFDNEKETFSGKLSTYDRMAERVRGFDEERKSLNEEINLLRSDNEKKELDIEKLRQQIAKYQEYIDHLNYELNARR